MRFWLAGLAKLRSACCCPFGAALASVVPAAERLEVGVVMVGAAGDVVYLIGVLAAQSAERVPRLAAVRVAPENASASSAPVAGQFVASVACLPAQARRLVSDCVLRERGLAGEGVCLYLGG